MVGRRDKEKAEMMGTCRGAAERRGVQVRRTWESLPWYDSPLLPPRDLQ